MKSYRKNYINTYIWQILAVLTGFASLFVVIPFITSNKTVYGIYSVCTSLTIFFSYADLGFLSAAQKYGAEFYAQGNLNKENRVIGFVAFLMFTVFAVLSLTVGVLAIWPRLLIPELQIESDDYNIARCLLSILCVSSFVMLANRILTTIYAVRVEQYKIQRIVTIGSMIKILSVFVFFTGGRYLIVPYYLFFQFVNLSIVLISLLGIKNYGYKLTEFVKCFRFDKEEFHLTKKLSIASLVATVSMILYYELDSIVISHTLGVEKVALYGVALNLLTIVRTYQGIVYAPYSSRFNHFVGNNDNLGLLRFTRKIIVTFDSIYIFPIVVLSLLALPFSISWVGDDFKDAAILVSILVLSFIPNFILNPISSYFYAKERSMELIRWNIVTPVIYWIGIVLSISYLGLLSFALFKVLALIVSTVAYLILASKDFKKEGQSLMTIREVITHILIPLVVCIIVCQVVKPHMFYHKDVQSLLYNIFIMGGCLLVTLCVGVVMNRELRGTIISYVKSIIHKGQ